ncbi:MAG: hypothetical protein IJS81_08360 [Selenomonadaceae bacterium]|nr:hypothetical protein [Selenomonadaceae bacterium]
MAAYVDINGLRTFKTKQDEYNLGHFASLSGGKVTAEQLPSFVDDVVEGYTLENAGVVTFYSDSEKTQAITGETGKIYVDLAATIDGTYRYTGSRFVPIGNSVSTADKAINDANGNPIVTTYATKNELSTASTTPATKSSLGVVQIGDNIDVDNGIISVKVGTAADKGILQVGTNISVANGVISVATATASEIGLAKAGTNINVDNAGTFSVNTATASGIGLAKAGTNINVDNAGTFSVNTASTSESGVVQIGSNISVANGVISLSSGNVTSALGYTPLDAASISAVTTAEIEGLFTTS